MKNSYQTDSETIYDHGKAVWNYFNKIITNDIGDMKIPDWYEEYKDRILKNLPNKSIIEKYCIFHDCGKPLCETMIEGKRHFPGHEQASYDTWMGVTDVDEHTKAQISNLIKHDMLFHTEKAEEILEKELSTSELCTLILSALSALHANADSFGGRDSDSFKIKFKNYSRRAKKVLEFIFPHEYVYVLVREDLSPAQRAVQSCHAVIEATRNFNMNGEHPSVIICGIKNELTLKRQIEYLTSNKIKFSKFYEPDINFELTAIATAPISGDTRNLFKKYQLLK